MSHQANIRQDSQPENPLTFPVSTESSHIPSPVITRRTRTASMSERAASNPVQYGKVKYFCRQRGHGFITPDDGSDDIFFHISDIEGEYAPRHGDDVTYKLCHIPPKMEKLQAVHVVITHLSPGTHERWTTSISYTRL